MTATTLFLALYRRKAAKELDRVLTEVTVLANDLAPAGEASGASSVQAGALRRAIVLAHDIRGLARKEPSEAQLLTLRSLADTFLVGAFVSLEEAGADRLRTRQLRDSADLMETLVGERSWSAEMIDETDFGEEWNERIRDYEVTAAGMPPLRQMSDSIDRIEPFKSLKAGRTIYFELYQPLSNLVAHTSAAALSRNVSLSEDKRLVNEPWPVLSGSSVCRASSVCLALLAAAVARSEGRSWKGTKSWRRVFRPGFSIGQRPLRFTS